MQEPLPRQPESAKPKPKVDPDKPTEATPRVRHLTEGGPQ